MEARRSRSTQILTSQGRSHSLILQEAEMVGDMKFFEPFEQTVVDRTFTASSRKICRILGGVEIGKGRTIATALHVQTLNGSPKSESCRCLPPPATTIKPAETRFNSRRLKHGGWRDGKEEGLRSPVDDHGCAHGGEDEDGGRGVHGVWTRTKALWWRLAGLRVVAGGVVEQRCLRRNCEAEGGKDEREIARVPKGFFMDTVKVLAEWVIADNRWLQTGLRVLKDRNEIGQLCQKWFDTPSLGSSSKYIKSQFSWLLSTGMAPQCPWLSPGAPGAVTIRVGHPQAPLGVFWGFWTLLELLVRVSELFSLPKYEYPYAMDV
ncbi:hypothetical protein V8G54_011106 [Vigna mungo]|uniref:Uncharacterized protein n=1 Tax=Vigna mungo TaxID=3915 RepID=A0AAQ3NQU9_VIGMU